MQRVSIQNLVQYMPKILRSAAAVVMVPLAAPLVCDVAFAQTVVVEPTFDDVGHFHEGMAPALSAGKWGFIDRAGKWVVQPNAGFDEVQTGSDGRFAVRTQKSWGFIGTGGKIMIEPRYQAVKPFSSGMAAVQQNGKWGYIGPSGNVIDDFSYDFAGPAWNGYRIVIDKENGLRLLGPASLALYAEYASEIIEIGPVGENGWAPVKLRDGWHFASVTGEGRPEAFKTVREFSEDLAAVSKDGKTWGFIDVKGKFIIPAKYEAAREFSRGIAPVKIKGKWGFIDKTAKLVLKPIYDNAYPVREGWAIFRVGDKRGFLKVSGPKEIATVVEAKYEDVFSPKEGYAPIKLNGKWGFLKLGEIDRTLVRDIAELDGQ